MKFGIFDQYGSLNSAPVFASFQKGLSSLGHTCQSHDMDADIAVIWSTVWSGRMRQNRQVWNSFRESGRPVVVLEVGSLHRGLTWKVGLNGTTMGCYNNIDVDPERPRQLGVDLAPWKSQGKNILIVLQRQDSHQWQGQPNVSTWLDSYIKELKKHTDRPIIVRPHPRQKIVLSRDVKVNHPIHVVGTYDTFDFLKSLDDTWAVINHNSGTGIQSILNGVPAFVDRSSLAGPVGNHDIKNIENPSRPDRQRWVVELCHSEWTLEEISSGGPIDRLF